MTGADALPHPTPDHPRRYSRQPDTGSQAHSLPPKHSRHSNPETLVLFMGSKLANIVIHTRSLNHVKVHVIPFCSDGQSISDVTTCVRHKRVRYSAIGWSVIWQHDARATSVSEPSRLPSEVRGRGRVSV